MILCAGILFITQAGEALFLKRGDGSDYPGYWCFPGGRSEGDETSEEVAIRETIEELGFLPDGERIVLTRSITEETDYTTFLQRVPERFDPRVNGENTGFAWAPSDQPPEPIHPGCAIAIARLKMDELGVADAIVAGQLTSPQKYENFWLFDVRLTGTGFAYRRGLDEYTWRDPSVYMTPEFLRRANGLPVIWLHPEGDKLDGKEFADRVVGTVFVPYFKNDEVWAVVKIWDEKAAELMKENQLSTSPGVVLADPETRRKVSLEDGSVLLIEGKPSLLDHVAICELGVWDKGGDPAGVRSDNIGQSEMADETEAERKAREDKARKDAEAGEKLDKLLSHMDTVMSRMDSLGSRMDAWEKEDKARKDADEKAREDARKDAKRRMDEEHEEWRREDAAGCALQDAEEEADKKRYMDMGDDPDMAMDKARKDRRARHDKMRKDAEERVAEAEKAKQDAARKDSDILKQLEELKARMPRERTDDERDLLASTQARWDSVETAFGSRAPAPMSDETALDYRIRLASRMQKHSKPWSGVELRKLAAIPEALANAEQMIFNDAQAASLEPGDVPAGQFREVHQEDRSTGQRSIMFVGKGTWIGQMKRPNRRVMAINVKGGI